MPSDSDDIERPRGILTPEQRRFLLDQLETLGDDESTEPLSPGAVRQRRYRIRERVKNALFDFNYLNMLPPEDEEQIFTDAPETPADLTPSNRRFFNALGNLFRFLYRNLPRTVFEDFVKQQIELETKDNLWKKDTHADVKVDITVDISNRTSVDELKAQYEAGKELTSDELISLSNRGRISNEEFREEWKAIYSPDEE